MVNPMGRVVHNTPILKRGEEASAVLSPCRVRKAKKWELIKAHSDSGLTVKQIAKKMGISESTIANAARNHKFEIRDEHGPIHGSTYARKHTESAVAYQPPKPEPLRTEALKPEPKPQPQPADDPVNHPAHYRLPGGGEAIDFIEDVCGDGVDEYYRGNILKYVCRYKEKGGAQSLKKARWYLDRLIMLQETREELEAEAK